MDNKTRRNRIIIIIISDLLFIFGALLFWFGSNSPVLSVFVSVLFFLLAIKFTHEWKGKNNEY